MKGKIVFKKYTLQTTASCTSNIHCGSNWATNPKTLSVDLSLTHFLPPIFFEIVMYVVRIWALLYYDILMFFRGRSETT